MLLTVSLLIPLIAFKPKSIELSFSLGIKPSSDSFILGSSITVPSACIFDIAVAILP